MYYASVKLYCVREMKIHLKGKSYAADLM